MNIKTSIDLFYHMSFGYSHSLKQCRKAVLISIQFPFISSSFSLSPHFHVAMNQKISTKEMFSAKEWKCISNFEGFKQITTF